MPVMSQVGQDGNRVFLDIAYVSDIQGNDHMCLGIIDSLTLCHVAVRVCNWESEYLWGVSQDVWICNFGMPTEITPDHDRPLSAP